MTQNNQQMHPMAALMQSQPQMPVQSMGYLSNLGYNPLTTSNDALSDGVGAGYPIISFKGKVWSVRSGDQKTVYLNAMQQPEQAIDVVLVAVQNGVSKTFYRSGYVEGSDTPPDCWSNDGIRPDASVASPCSSACAQCPFNQLGSKISDGGSKVKAYRRS